METLGLVRGSEVTVA